MFALLVSYFAVAIVVVVAVAGPLIAGRWLAERDDEPDPELRAIEAHALLLLAGSASDER